MNVVSRVMISCGSGVFCKRWKLLFVAKNCEEKRSFCFCVVAIGFVSGIIVGSDGACVSAIIYDSSMLWKVVLWTSFAGRFLSDLWCFPWGYHLLYSDHVMLLLVFCWLNFGCFDSFVDSLRVIHCPLCIFGYYFVSFVLR